MFLCLWILNVFKKNEINKVNISLLITNGQGMMEKEGLLLDCFSLKKSNFFLEPSDHMLLAETFLKVLQMLLLQYTSRVPDFPS